MTLYELSSYGVILIVCCILSIQFKRLFSQTIRFDRTRISAHEFRIGIYKSILLSAYIFAFIFILVIAFFNVMPYPWPVSINAFDALNTPAAFVCIYVVLIALIAQYRLQDLNVNGYVAYIMYAILPIIQILNRVFLFSANFALGVTLELIAFLFTLILTIALANIQGSPGPNYYGDPEA